MTETTDDRELELVREMPFPPALVWQAMTDPDHMVNWWGPDGFTIEHLTMDLRVGGVWAFDMVGPDGTRFPNHAVYTEISPPTRLVFDQGDGQSVWFVATVELTETDTGTRVRLHQRYPSQVDRDRVIEEFGALEGGKQHLAKWERYVAENLA